MFQYSARIVPAMRGMLRTPAMFKSNNAVQAPKKTKAPARAKKTTSGTILPKGMNMQGEERVMMSQTTMVDGKPVTKTIMKARKYYTDPKTGKVIEEAIPIDPKSVGDQAAAQKEMAAAQKEIESAQDNFRASRLDFHDRLMHMRDEMRNLWRFPF